MLSFDEIVDTFLDLFIGPPHEVKEAKDKKDSFMVAVAEEEGKCPKETIGDNHPAIHLKDIFEHVVADGNDCCSP